MKLLSLIVLTSFFIACTKESINKTSTNRQSNQASAKDENNNIVKIDFEKSLSEEKFISKLLQMKKTHEDNIFLTSFNYDSKNHTFTITKINEKKISLGLAIGINLFNNRNNQSDRPEVAYTVSCSGGGGGDWEKDCDGTISCGRLISSCLDGGGCAGICEGIIAIDPPSGVIIVNPSSDLFKD